MTNGELQIATRDQRLATSNEPLTLNCGLVAAHRIDFYSRNLYN